MVSLRGLGVYLGAVAVVAASCEGFPRPRFPQVEGAVEIVEGAAGERFAAHRTCVKSSISLEPLLLCMRNAGYDFIARGPDYPAAECWRLRERGGADLSPAYCFERPAAGSPPAGPAAIE